jgi:hypothetical protein
VDNSLGSGIDQRRVLLFAGRPPETLNYKNIPVLPATNPNLGMPSCTVDNSSRRLQFGVRYAF